MPFKAPDDEVMDAPAPGGGFRAPDDEVISGGGFRAPSGDLPAITPESSLRHVLLNHATTAGGPPQAGGNWAATWEQLQETPEGRIAAGIGQGFQAAGKFLYEAPTRAMEHTAEEFSPLPPGMSNAESQQASQDVPLEDTIRTMPAYQRAIVAAGKGIVESVPQLAANMAIPEAAPIIWGSTPEGFDPKQAVIATLLPTVGKYTGAITEAISSKAGVSNDAALAVLNKLGGAGGAAGLIGADQIATISQLPPEQRQDALIDAVGNVGSMFLLGGMGDRHQFGKAEQPPEMPPAAPPLPAGGGFKAPADEVVPQGEPTAPTAAGVKYPPIVARMMADLQADPNAVQQNAPEIEQNANAVQQNALSDQSKPLSADKAASTGTPSAEPTIAQKAAATPDKPVTLADLASLQKEMTANQVQPAKPSTVKPPSMTADDGTPSEPLESPAASLSLPNPQAKAPAEGAEPTPAPVVAAPPMVVGGEPAAGEGATKWGVTQDGEPYGLFSNERQARMAASGLSGEVEVKPVTADDVAEAQQQFQGTKLQQPLSILPPSDEAGTIAEGSRNDRGTIAEGSRNDRGTIAEGSRKDRGTIAERSRDAAEQDALETVQEAFGLNKAQSARLAELQAKNANPLKSAPQVAELANPEDTAGESPVKASVRAKPAFQKASDLKNATAAVHSAMGTDPKGELPSGVRVIRDESAPWGAQIEGRNKITVNAARISTPERAKAVILEEGFHGVWYDPALQRAWQAVRDLVTPEEMAAERKTRLAQGLPVDAATIREEAAIARLVKGDANRGVFAQVFDAARAAFKRLFGFDLPGTNRQMLKDAALKFLQGDREGHAEPGSELERVMKLGTEETKKSIGDKARSIADSLESLKTGIAKGGQLHAFGIAADLWDRAVSVAQAAIRAGGTVADAISAAIDHIRQNHTGNFDEDGARQALGEATKPKLRLAKDATANEPPAEPEVDWKKLKQDAADANARSVAANEAIRNAQQEANPKDNLDVESHATAGKGGVTPEMQQERRDAQAAAMAAREKLLRSPGYIRSRIDEFAGVVKRKAAADAVGEPNPRTAARQEMDSYNDEFRQMPEGAFADAWKAAQEDGTLPKDQMMPVGRSLRDLTDKLEKSDIDSPKVPMSERMNIARAAANAIGDAKDAYQKAARGVRAAWAALKSGIYDPPISSHFREVMKDWFAADQQTGHETYRWIKAIESKVSNPVRRRAISAWVDANGDEGTLRAQRADLEAVAGGKHVPVWDAALKLTDGEKEIGRQIIADFETKLEDAKNVGMIDKGRENYGVPQIWKTPPKADESSAGKGSAGNFRAKLDPRDPFFSLQRETPSYFDGIMRGGEPKDMDVGKLVAVYNEAFHKNLSSRAAIWGLKDAKSADGTPVVRISGDAHYEVLPTGKKRLLVDATRRPGDAVTKDGRPYRAIDHWALKGWQYKGSDPHGNPVLVKGDFLVHPDHFQFLNNELNGTKWRQAEPGPVGPDGRPTMRRTPWGAAGHAALSVSSFLKNSKMALGMFHLFNVATHSVWNGVNPITKDFKLDMTNPEQAAGVRNGVELGFGSHRVDFEEGQTGAHGGLWAHVPGLGRVAGRMTDFIFKDVLPKMKMKNYLALNEANTKLYGKKLTPDQISEISAHQTNAAFGLQNYRLLGTSKAMMDFNRLICLAPDFLGSEFKQTAQAFTKYGGAQRRAIVVQAAAMYALARVVNASLNNGDSHWEPENALSVVYKGRAYSIRSLVADMFHMVSDPGAFMAGRLGPLPHTIADVITGRDMRFGTRIDTVARTGVGRAAERALRDTLGWLAPIGTTGFGPGAAKRGETPFGTLAAAQVGLSSRQYTPATQMYDAAAQFNRNNPDPKAQEYQANREAEVYQQSVYKGLDNLLQAGDSAAAQREYKALVAEGHTPAHIEARYQRESPFTGSADREAQFKAQLTDSQWAAYQQAIQDRAALKSKFDSLPK